MADTYNYDMQRLQQDAIRRAREMQSRAQAAVSQPNRNMPNPTVSNTQAHHSAPPPQRAAVPPPVSPAEKPGAQYSNNSGGGQMAPFRNLFDTLFDDSERTLILVLMLLLVEEQADTGLIFALLYLVL